MIGKVIQKKRKAVGLSQAKLAELLGVTAPAVNRWEKDMSYPDATLLAPLARALNTDLNELFSFYDSLSETERTLAVDYCRDCLLNKPHEEALMEIEKVLHQNASDGLLFKQMANMMFGIHAFRKVDNPTIYLNEIASYYERAQELLGDITGEIAEILVGIYASLGDQKKAEESFACLKETNYDKQLTHADMLNMLKDYDGAEREYKAYILRKAVDLLVNLWTLGDVMSKKGDQESAELATRKGEELCKLFGLWCGFDTVSTVTSAINAGINGLEQVMDQLFSLDVTSDTLSSDPLFNGIRLEGEKTTATIMENIMDLLREAKKERQLA